MNVKVNAWVNGILGTWIFIAAFLNFSAIGNMWDNLIVGIIVATFGFSMFKSKPWQGWVSGIMGVWLVVAAFIPGLQVDNGNMWNEIISGIIIAIAGYGALGTDSEAVS